MHILASPRLLLLACCLVSALTGCIQRIDPAGNPVKPVEQPIVGTHVSPPESH